MITKTLNLNEEYQQLFDDVRIASHDRINIDNLDAFYGSIEEIANLSPKFLRLPLDEPLFDIDANTRKITVPDVFRANGVSVQRDHLAEVIFFRIERYFDYTDLSTCDIVINWKMGSKEGKTTRFIKFEKDFTIDEIKSNYIIFGWPLNDVVTEKSGQLNFAIEFFKVDGNNEVMYRFNTLPATVNIKDGLVINDEITPIVLDNDITRTLVNSKFGEGNAAVGDIEWHSGDGHGLVAGNGFGDDVVLRDFMSPIYLNTTIENGEPESDPIDLYAEGFIDSGTKIRYTDKDGQELTASALKVNRPRVLVTYEPNSNRLYYANASDPDPLTPQQASMMADNNEELWAIDALDLQYRYYKMNERNDLVVASEGERGKWGTEDQIPLYVLVAKITVNEAGQYYIKAQGEKYNNKGDKIGSGDVSLTDIVEIPEPEVPSAIDIQIPPFNKAGYEFDEENNNVLFLDNEGNGSLTATTNLDHYGALRFVWYKKDGNNYINIQDNGFSKEDQFDELINITEPGIYTVGVENYQNGKSAKFGIDDVENEEKEQNEVIVSHLASEITSVTAKWSVGNNGIKFDVTPNRQPSYNSTASQFQRSVTLYLEDIVYADDIPVGELEYRWYTPVYGDIDEETGISKISDKILIPNATNASYTIANSGDIDIIPEVRNKYNGSVFVYTLDLIKVDDQKNNN